MLTEENRDERRSSSCDPKDRSSSWENVRDLAYDPDVDSHYSEASNARMKALVERLKVVAANAREAKAREAAQSRPTS